MNATITKAELRKTLGFDTDAQLAEFFDITASAISLWKEDGPVPELRRLQAQQRRPDAFQQVSTSPEAPASQAQVA